jgi:hypothetical protein
MTIQTGTPLVGGTQREICSSLSPLLAQNPLKIFYINPPGRFMLLTEPEKTDKHRGERTHCPARGSAFLAEILITLH